MDANRTRFHALWGHAGDWDAALAAPGASGDVKAADGVLRLKDTTPEFGYLRQSRLTPDARRGAARDRFGNWYWIDPDRRRVLVQSSGSRAVGVFWPAPAPARGGPFTPTNAPGQPGKLAGLTVTRRHALVVGALEPAGLLVFNLISGGPPRRVAPPAGTPFAPFDLAPLGDGFVLLDRDNRAVWAFD
ncbi:MAG: hypothetical protein K2V38_25425, partial [Gemmataceae bacterium]|nr:hypothetical protein [Gemmataceae bacterium]